MNERNDWKGREEEKGDRGLGEDCKGRRKREEIKRGMVVRNRRGEEDRWKGREERKRK